MPRTKATKTTQANASAKRVIAIHRTFDEVKKGEAIFYVAEQGEKIKKLSGLKLEAFLKSITGGMTIRVSSTGYFLPILAAMQRAGAVIESAHWHDTGIEKGAGPEVIAEAFLNLPATVVRPIQLREDLHILRQLVNARTIHTDVHKAASQRLTAVARSMGYGDDAKNKPLWLTTEEEMNKQYEKDNERPVVKEIEKHASTITECIVLKNILAVKGPWGTAASVIAYVGDPKRFNTVSALWHYAGFHVVKGKAPKREKGSPMTWNPKLRTALWLWAESMIKNMNSPWRPVYDRYKAEEAPIHLEKHPECKTVDGHVAARAKRRVIKDVLKEFYRQMNGEQQPVKIEGMEKLTAAPKKRAAKKVA